MTCRPRLPDSTLARLCADFRKQLLQRRVGRGWASALTGLLVRLRLVTVLLPGLLPVAVLLLDD